MAEFEVGGKIYRSTKMNAFQQFHVARKLGPILAKLGPNLTNKPDGSATSMVELLEPAVDALAEMAEADCDFVLHRCLSVTQRKMTDSAWMPVWNEGAKQLQFQDIDLMIMIHISMYVLGDNLGNFIGAPPSTSSQPSLPG